MLKEEEIHCLDVQDLLSSAFGENQILNGNSDSFLHPCEQPLSLQALSPRSSECNSWLHVLPWLAVAFLTVRFKMPESHLTGML